MERTLLPTCLLGQGGGLERDDAARPGNKSGYLRVCSSVSGRTTGGLVNHKTPPAVLEYESERDALVRGGLRDVA